jgi:sulfatase maturation enzyme AslB (radical SAM superfamily)
MTCSSDLSDFWEEEYKIHYPDAVFRNVNNRVSITTETARKLIDTFPNVQRISFIGGEPTISNEHVEFLKMLINKGRSRNIDLGYVTNLTGLTDELLDIWDKFKNIHLSVSIDGFGKVNEYIRYPFKWSKTETSLKTIMKLCQDHVQSHKYTLGLSCTHSVYNAIQAPDLIEYFYDTLKTYECLDGNTLLKHCGAFVNRVSSPKDAMVSNLSIAYRNIGIEKINRLLNKIQVDVDNGIIVERGLIESIQLMGAWLAEPQSDDTDNINTLIKFIKVSDEFRNRNINDYIPELMTELEQMKQALTVD